MPAFRYEAINAAGKTLKGVLDADSARAGRGQLRTQGLTPLVVEPASTRMRGERNQRLSMGRRLSQREQAILTRQLASLLIAGLPLDETLTVLLPVNDQMSTSPVEVLRQTRPSAPLPLKSPTPSSAHTDGMTPKSWVLKATELPSFDVHTSTSLVLLFRQMMSARPSPLKSPNSWIVQDSGMTPRFWVV